MSLSAVAAKKIEAPKVLRGWVLGRSGEGYPTPKKIFAFFISKR